MGNLLVTLQLGTLSATTLRTINRQIQQDEDQHGDNRGELPGAGGPGLGQVLPGGEEREQVCGRRVRETDMKIFPHGVNFFFSNSYKCAVFFENLTSKRKLTRIGALPDALKKARNKEEVAEILGADVTQASFKQLESCDNVTANARCYTILDKQRKLPLDSCDR